MFKNKLAEGWSGAITSMIQPYIWQNNLMKVIRGEFQKDLQTFVYVLKMITSVHVKLQQKFHTYDHL